MRLQLFCANFTTILLVVFHIEKSGAELSE